MPINNENDRNEVDKGLQRIMDAPDDERRAQEARRLFVDRLDFHVVENLISLPSAAHPALPHDARRIAARDRVSLAYIPLAADRIPAAAVNAAAKAVSATLNDDLILLFANSAGDLLHFVHPTDPTAARPRLRRLVIRKGESHRTAVQQLANMWNAYGVQAIPTLDAVRQAFSVDPVTRAFFTDYRRAFDRAKQAISGFPNDPQGDERRHIFTQTLFNRLMFIYFVQRKRWLSYNGDPEYLQALWRAHQNAPDGEFAPKNFYADRLRLLYVAGLNNNRSEDLTDAENAVALIGNVPFLNGGLFANDEFDDDWSIHVPDEVIDDILTNLFNKYNFTVAESTPYDQEVAVDPEMLGKVFEELVTGRHESGSFYTPREVVAFMCREALKAYLETQCPRANPDAIAAFVDDRHAANLPRSEKPAISAALDDVRVVDPACGSGAYLLGMMQELLALRDALFNENPDDDPEPLDEYNRKLHIISNNLYGVDKDDFAVNIAQLRLWLSLAIEYDGDNPPPLPNLDFKASPGDSLLAPAPQPILQSDIFTDRISADDLGKLKARYLRSHGNEKRRLADEIKNAEHELRDALGDATAPPGAADWRILFAEVFAQPRAGFDIALANPPYVRQEAIPAAAKTELAKLYPQAAVKRSDLYCYFYARALELLREGGVHAFICSNSWLDVGYGAKLQQYLLDNAHIRAIYESAVERQFSTAAINTIITIARKGKPADANAAITEFIQLQDEFDKATAPNAQDKRRVITKTAAALRAAGSDPAKRGNKSASAYIGDKWGGKYLRAPDIYHRILDKYADKMVRLGDIAEVRFGIKTGANEFFFLTSETIRQFGIEKEYYAPAMKSASESHALLIDAASLPLRLFMCYEDKADLAGTGALAYIEWGESQGFHRRRSVASRRRWWDVGKRELSQIAINYQIHASSRIFFDKRGAYFSNNFQTIKRDSAEEALKLVGAMNSSLSQMMFNINGRANLGGGLLKIETYEVANLPLVNPALVNLDESILASADWDIMKPIPGKPGEYALNISPARRALDAAVFDALCMPPPERAAVYAGVSALVGGRLARARRG